MGLWCSATPELWSSTLQSKAFTSRPHKGFRRSRPHKGFLRHLELLLPGAGDFSPRPSFHDCSVAAYAISDARSWTICPVRNPGRLLKISVRGWGSVGFRLCSWLALRVSTINTCIGVVHLHHIGDINLYQKTIWHPKIKGSLVFTACQLFSQRSCKANIAKSQFMQSRRPHWFDTYLQKTYAA